MKDLFYIAGGVLGGWFVAKKIFGDSSSFRKNPKYEEWELDWLDLDGNPSKFESNVIVDGEAIGSFIMQTPKKWLAYDKKLKPFGEFASSEAAGRAVYNQWSSEKFLAGVFSAPEKPKKKKTPTPPPPPKPPTPKPKGPYEIAWESQLAGDIYVGNKMVGSIRFDSEEYSWEAYEGFRNEPFEVGISSKKKAAEKVFKKFKGLRDLPEPTIVQVKVPDWITDIEVEPAVGKEGDRFIVWVADDRAGVIEKRGGRYDAYVPTKKGDIQLEIGSSRQRAIKAVYVTHAILKYLPEQKVRGKKISYSPRRWKTLPPKKRGQRPRKVELFGYRWHYIQRSSYEIGKDLGIPENEVILYGTKLADNFLIYGVISEIKKKTFTTTEKDERVIPSHKTYPVRRTKRRRIVQADIEKLRKGGKLSKEERKALPSIRKKKIYRFAMVGPQGEVGFDVRAHGAEWQPHEEES